MIKPKYKVFVRETVPDGTYVIETKDIGVFEFLREFGKVYGTDQYQKYFTPYKLYDPCDIKDMLDTIQENLNWCMGPAAYHDVRGDTFHLFKHRLKKETTIETMKVGESGYTLPWSFLGREALKGTMPVEKKAGGTCDMPIKRVSEDRWEVEASKSYFWKDKVRMGVTNE